MRGERQGARPPHQNARCPDAAPDAAQKMAAAVELAPEMKNSAILLISCPDAKGEVATIADFVFRHGGNILHADEHGDEESGLFLMRVEFDPQDFDIPLADFGKYFSPTAETFAMKWRLAQSSHRA